jgi:citrate lyase subunit beta/citryl-CoA lyase
VKVRLGGGRLDLDDVGAQVAQDLARPGMVLQFPATTMAPDPAPVARRLARSYLFAPGSHERLLRDAFAAGADAVVVDLEDSVAAEHKPYARELARRVLVERGPSAGPLVFVRINSVQSGLWRDDLDAIVCPGLDGVRVARTESARAISDVDEALTRLERARGLVAGSLEVIPTIESAAGVAGALAIASAPRVRALAFGRADFLQDISAAADAGDPETLYARAHLVVASRAAGVLPPIAPVHPRLGDPDDLRRSSLAARRLGFFGRSCVHPSQLGIIHEVFTPAPTELDDARALVAAFAEAPDGSPGLVLPDGRYVDRALADRARALLALASQFAGVLGPSAPDDADPSVRD